MKQGFCAAFRMRVFPYRTGYNFRMNFDSRINHALNKIHPLPWHFICIAISIVVFSLVLLNRSPNFLRPLSMALRTGFGLIIPAIAIAMYLVYRLPGRFGELASLTATL